MSAFLDMHEPGRPLLAPNPWDLGSARLLASLGFRALATTSSGLAASLGLLDGQVGRERSLLHARALAEATGLPVSADLEDGFAADAGGVAETIALACEHGLAGASVEDWRDDRAFAVDEAAERVRAAAEAAGDRLVLTARADNFVNGVSDLDDTIGRLRAFAAAGAHVVYAPGLERIEDVAAVVDAVGVPVNFLMRPGGPAVAQLAAAGVARITVGGAFAFAALGALAEAARQLLDEGSTGDGRLTRIGAQAAGRAFGG